MPRQLLLALIALAADVATPAAHGQTSPAVFGRHYPHGADAVEYIYGPEGMWRDESGLTYQWNYYDQCATPAHPANRIALIAMGSASNVTAPDATCVLLGDANGNKDVADDVPKGFAFHEHAGRGVGGAQTAAPFYQFWFDDNWVARYMSVAYGKPLPSGLYDHGDPTRWRLLGGDNSHWEPYAPSRYVDQIALNGIYEINRANFAGALADWNAIRDLSGFAYSSANQRYEYPAITSTYQLGLWAILSERLLAASSNFPQEDEILQHAISLRSNLLSMQERNAEGARLGWRTEVGNLQSLINTETLAISVLALGANATFVFEPGYAPLSSSAGNYFTRPHNVLSAVTGVSKSGLMVSGPGWTLEPGTYDADFALRVPATAVDTPLATVSVQDGATVLASAVVNTGSMPANNEWRRYRLTANVASAANSIQFLVDWQGTSSVDVGPIRVSKRVAQQSVSQGASPQPVTTSKESAGPTNSSTAGGGGSLSIFSLLVLTLLFGARATAGQRRKASRK